MNRSSKLSLLATALLACAGTTAATTHTLPASQAASSSSAETTSPSDTKADRGKILKAMDAADTWGHPDLFGEFAGMKRYAKGEYKSAMKYFLFAARYADKPSQLAIGIMYVNGLGVEKDVATGCAWLDLAAERKYPRFVATYDVNCKTLTSAQRQQMASVLNKLQPEYGDAVAKHRMATALRVARTERTGSHVGFDSGAQVHSGAGAGFSGGSLASSAPRNCRNEVIYSGGMTIPTKGCTGNDFWSADRWDPKKYFAARDAQWRGTVTVGALQQANDPASGTNPGKPSTAQPEPAAAGTSGP